MSKLRTPVDASYAKEMCFFLQKITQLAKKITQPPVATNCNSVPHLKIRRWEKLVAFVSPCCGSLQRKLAWSCNVGNFQGVSLSCFLIFIILINFNFNWFFFLQRWKIGLNKPFRLFSHHISWPKGPMKK